MTVLAQISAAAAEDGLAIDRKGNLEDAAYAQLRAALIDGHFVPGQSFTIRALASVFGTSVMPVRDALKRLVAERALDLLPNRTVIVPRMSRARFEEVLQIRLALEPQIAERATVHATPELIAAMVQDDTAMQDAVDAGNAARYLSSNRRFHFRLYAMADMQVMQSVIEAMWMQVGPYINQVFREGDNRGTRQAGGHHAAVIEALRKGDGRSVGHAIASDLSDAANAILTANWFFPEAEEKAA
ncbi:MAG: GntR family transcriptional regulator [Pseudomonadota bacterium]